MTSEHFQTIPWNGYKGAISLTFDDGDPSQLQVAIPEMTKRGIRGTFYLIYNRLSEVEAWKDVFKSGQELGNHTMDHKHGYDLDPQQALEQVQNARKALEDTFQVSAPTFAYPFTEITPALRAAARSHHFLSRGGYGPVYMSAEQEPDWEYLASQVIYSHTSSGVLKGWTEQNLLDRTWSLPQFHAFSGSAGGWQPLPVKTFTDFLDDLTTKKQDLWIAPIGEVGAYRMAETLLQKIRPKVQGNQSIFTWKKPVLMPRTMLKLKCGKAQIWQKEKKLTQDSEGNYIIDFDQEEMTLI